jgi:hypothetical protein
MKFYAYSNLKAKGPGVRTEAQTPTGLSQSTCLKCR